MKTLFLSILVSLSTLVATAQIYTVNNNPGQSADYASLQAAINSVPSGAVLLVQGSGISYGDINVTQSVVIIGPGYNLSQNPAPYTQANGLSANIDELRIKPGGAGALLSGLNVLQQSYLDTVSNVIIQSCKFNHRMHIKNSANITIERCLSYNNTTYNIYSYGSTNVNIRHNIFTKNTASAYYPLYVVGGSSSGPSHAVFEHNTILREYASAYTCLFATTSSSAYPANITSRNNIWVNTHSSPSTMSSFSPNANGYGVITLSNEVVSDSSFQSYSSITMDADPADMFQHWGNSGYGIDYILQTKAGSPALGAGQGGADCGAFGGAGHYLISGLSIVPNIYEITMPTLGTTGYGVDVHIKAKANQ